MSRLSNLRANANRWGLGRAFLNLFVRGIARYLGIHIYVVRCRRIPESPTYPDTDRDLDFRLIEPEELLGLSKDPELNMGVDFVTAAIARGDLAYGAFDGRLLVSYIWRCVDYAPDADDVWIRIKKPYNYSYKSFTRSTHRGQRISPAVHLFSDAEMRKLGYEYRVGFVGVTNYPSLEMGKHMGSVIIGYAGYIAWFGLLFPFRSRPVKEIGFEFFRSTSAT